jgi:hypothetical protein
MAYSVPPQVAALKKCMGWFHGLKVHNVSAYAPGVLSIGGTAVGEGVAPNSLPLSNLPLPLKVISFCFLVAFIISYTRSSRQRLPPQPRGLPVIGNFFQFADRRWLFSRDCKERFGEHRVLIQSMMTYWGAWDTRRGHVPRCIRKADNHLQQSKVGFRCARAPCQ